jgi:hypothetical protein
MTVADLKELMAIYLGRTAASDLTLNSVDTALYALNSARRLAERSHNFKYAEDNAFISVGSTGANIIGGCYEEAAFTNLMQIKRIETALLPLTNGEYQPIEFMTQTEFLSRVRRQTGRTLFNASKTLAQLGVSTENVILYQNGHRVYLYPAPASAITVQLECVRWMPDYSVSVTTDFFTQFAPEYLQWQAILECNKFWRRYVPKQESNIDEAAVQAMADAALQSLIAWDYSTVSASSTPEQQTETVSPKPKK